MRRKDREITEPAEALAVLRRCETLRVGMLSEGWPYVVPVSFAVEEGAQGRVAVYFHIAAVGRKVEALEQNARVCIEGDIFYRNERVPMGITARYESVIGFGTAVRVEGEEKLHGLRLLVERYGYADYPVDTCHGLSHTAVYKVELSTLTGKRNLPPEG